MKVAFASDIHTEFGQIELKNTENADILILAGDICVAKDLFPYDDAYENFRSQRVHDFFVNCSNEFKDVILIAGNHTFYHGDFKTGIEDYKKHLNYIKNLHILDNEYIEIDNTIFVGSTLWTNMNDNDQETIDTIKYCMNDFRVVSNSKNMVRYNDSDGKIRYKPSKFTPTDAIEEFNKSVKFLEYVIDSNTDKSIIVITHHSPSYKSIAPLFKDDSIMNGGYHSNCEYLMKPNVKIWAFGHTHTRHSYYINDTLLICNPRGYIGYEACADNFKLKTIDLINRPTNDQIKLDNYWEFFPE